MTLTYTLQIWNENADLPSGESSPRDDSSAPDDSFASALTSLGSTCDISAGVQGGSGGGGGGGGGGSSSKEHEKMRMAGRGRRGSATTPSSDLSASPTRHSPSPSPSRSRERSSTRSLSPSLHTLAEACRVWSEPTSDDSLRVSGDDAPPPLDTEEHPPPDEVVGDDTTEWHEDYSDTSWAESDRDLSTLWDVPSFDQDSELDGEVDADNSWDNAAAPRENPSSFPGTDGPRNKVLNMFRRAEAPCDSTWHAHVDPHIQTQSGAARSLGVEDVGHVGHSFRHWCHTPVINRSPMATLDTIQESSSRGGSPLQGALRPRMRPRSRSHSSGRAREISLVARKHARSRSGSTPPLSVPACGNPQCNHDFCHALSAASASAASAASAVAAASVAAVATWSLALDDDTRRVLARFQGFTPLRQGQESHGKAPAALPAAPPATQPPGQDPGQPPPTHITCPWAQKKAGAWAKSAALGAQEVLVDESLLSPKDRARYRRHLRRLRLRSARLLDFASDSDDISEIEDVSASTSIMTSTKFSEPQMSSD